MPDNDLISRAAAIEAALNWRVTPGGEVYNAIKIAIKSVIDCVPAVDAVPVVRCKDCRYYNGIKCERRDIGGYRLGHWYCADGERANAPTCGPDYCEIGGDEE